MIIVILGGTFDPFHNGHLAMAKEAVNNFNLDEIWLMPNKIPPHKRDRMITAEEDRVNMVKIIADKYESFVYSDFDIKRDGPSYTADTLRLIKEEYDVDRIFFIIGGDSIRDIRKWYHPEIVMENCTLLVATRDEVDKEELNHIINGLKDEFTCDIRHLPMANVDVSSTSIREQLKTNRDFENYKDVLDKDVFDYIIRHDLYLD